MLSGSAYAYKQCVMLRLKRGAIILYIAVRCDVNQDGDIFLVKFIGTWDVTFTRVNHT